MKNKYKATPKTYTSQARRNGKVTAQLVGLLARADVHVEEKELKSISTEEQERLAHIYHSGGVTGRRWMEGDAQFFPYVNRDVEVIQGRNRFPHIGRLHQIQRFDPPVNVSVGEQVRLTGEGRVFIGYASDPDNMREIGVAREVRVDLAPARDRTALVQMDFAGAEARVVHNYNIQAMVAEDMVRAMSRRMEDEILNGVGYATGRMSDAAQSAVLTFDSLSEALARVDEIVFGGRQFGRRYIAEKNKKKEKRLVHPDAGKTVVRRKTRRTLLGVVVADVRVRSGAIKRTSQLGHVVESQRRGKNGRK